MADENEVLVRIERDGGTMLLGADDEVEHEVMDDRGQPLEPLRLRDGICEVHVREGFRRI